MSATISVVIPVLNDAAMLESCLHALRHQTRPADEIIVVDNGCTDDSVTVARRFGARVVTEPRRGITAASAHGFDVAAGMIIARCDADSRVSPDWLERIERSLAVHPDAVAVTGPASFYDLGPISGAAAKVLYLSGYFVSMRLLLGHTVLFGSNCAVRADVWRAVSAMVPRDDSEIHDDMDLSYRLPATADVLYDRGLVVGISGRPFDSLRVFGRRLSRAVRTFSLHLPAQLPHRRWAQRLSAQRRRTTLIALPEEARA
ncbi:glycosyltransferase family 2 protein [Glaciihabitans sp. dw_435]|uniref:glycosyltransferase family 2 protein n=1 Tax=Glaciihabitans sp. dw_435 TaxID=2720081 RepID=UPI001BD5B7A8|nr:glycosyltransferase family 2 protein [Glaciihabitans sp. dw_435]